MALVHSDAGCSAVVLLGGMATVFGDRNGLTGASEQPFCHGKNYRRDCQYRQKEQPSF